MLIILSFSGLQRSVCNELFKATRQITESLSAAISVVTDPPAPHMLAEIPEAYEQVEDSDVYERKFKAMANQEKTGDSLNKDGELVANSFHEGIKVLEAGIARTAAKPEESANKSADMDIGSEDMSDNRFNLQINLKSERTKIKDINGQSGSYSSKRIVPEPPPAPAITLKQILALDLNIESITRYQAKPKSMYTFLCAQQFRRDEYLWHFKNVHSDIHGGLSGWLEHRCPLATYGCTYSTRRLHPTPKGSKLVHNNIIEAFGVQPHVPNEHLGQTTETSSLSKLSVRDSNHAENVATQKDVILPNCDVDYNTKESTPEILTSKDYDSAVYINGNADLIKKDVTNAVICDSKEDVRNSDVEKLTEDEEAMDDCDQTNGVTEILDNIPQEDSSDCDMLTSLPFEVLMHIIKFLDPFSLGNIALTNKALREVACSLLETRGIVLLHWERQRIGLKVTWQTIYKVCTVINC